MVFALISIQNDLANRRNNPNYSCDNLRKESEKKGNFDIHITLILRTTYMTEM